MGSRRSRNVRRRSLQKRKKRITIRNRRVSRRKNTRNRRVSRRKNTRRKRSYTRKSRVIRRSIKTPMAPREGKKMIGGGGWNPKYAPYGTMVSQYASGAYGDVFEVELPEDMKDVEGLQLSGVEVPSGRETYVLKVQTGVFTNIHDA